MKRKRSPLRLWLLGVGAVLLCACATTTSTRSTDYGSARPGGFDPHDYYARRALYVLHGEASYYADSLAGNSTASGAPYDPSAFTAAHRGLPFGTVLRVVRPDTGQWVLVQVNDRGPYAGKNRILDVSRAAARELGILHKGVAVVDIEVLELGRKPAHRRRH